MPCVTYCGLIGGISLNRLNIKKDEMVKELCVFSCHFRISCLFHGWANEKTRYKYRVNLDLSVFMP